MSQNQTTRITAENFDEDLFETVIDETHGQLGHYEVKEVELLEDKLKEIGDDRFELQFRPSNSDPNFGRLRLKPNSREGVRRLDRARARSICARNRGVSFFHGIGLAQKLKRSPYTNNPKVQDFMIRHAYDQDLLDLCEDPEMFIEHVRNRKRDDFSDAQLRAMVEFLPVVREVLERVPKDRQEDSENGDSSTENEDERVDEEEETTAT